MQSLELSGTTCKLWVVVENSEDIWWQKLNFNSAFLLANIQNYRKTSRPLELQQIIQEIQWPEFKLNKKPNHNAWTLVGCKNHFDADWLFLIHDLNQFNELDLHKTLDQLNIKNIRCFHPFEPSPSLKARLEHCDLVSSSKN